MAGDIKIGKKIKELREKIGMTQEQLAEKVGYTAANKKSSISKIEKGERDISRDKIPLFAKVLNTTVSELMDWDTREVSDIDEKLIAYTPNPKEQKIKDLIEKSNLPEDKLDILIDMIESWG